MQENHSKQQQNQDNPVQIVMDLLSNLLYCTVQTMFINWSAFESSTA